MNKMLMKKHLRVQKAIDEQKRLQICVSMIPGNLDIIVDLGCGMGFFTDKLAAKAKYTIAVDLSSEVLHSAKASMKNNKKCDYIQATVNALPLKKHIADAITCLETLEHVPSPQTAILETRRICKDNGLLVISVPYKEKLKRIQHTQQGKITLWSHLHTFDENTLTTLLKPHFKITEIDYLINPLLKWQWVSHLHPILWRILVGGTNKLFPTKSGMWFFVKCDPNCQNQTNQNTTSTVQNASSYASNI